MKPGTIWYAVAALLLLAALLGGCASLPNAHLTYHLTWNLPGYDCFRVEADGWQVPGYACGRAPHDLDFLCVVVACDQWAMAPRLVGHVR